MRIAIAEQYTEH
jgi:chromosome segregation ATPase